MKTISTETLHIILSKHIDLVSAYSDDAAIGFIIKMCRLKPADLLFGKWTEKLILYRTWVDEQGNTFEITDKKKVKIQLNDLKLKNQVVSSDLYENLPIEKISKISRLAFFMVAKDEDKLEDHALVSFLGVDGFLRTYCLLYGEWSKIPNLYLGFNILRQIANNEDIKYFKEIKVKDMPYPCINTKAALSYMPANEKFISTLKQWNEPLLHTINL